ncbi:MAG TPA: nitroreductase family protein [Candidatus Glassbacteria bacterium]|nr:nitroreductase family protein [Candidatus Glassbacteria bacterium]
MSLIDYILSRRSIRKYEKREIPEKTINQILKTGQNAPSAANKQPFHFIILKDQEIKKKISTTFSRFIKDVPIVIVGCANEKALITGKWAVIDTTIAMQNMVIAAWTLGVGSCWIGSFNEKKVKQLLKIPDKWKVVALITLGYPAEQPKKRKKKTTEKMFSQNTF